MLEIDGSHGEGGGQLLRTAVALSAITGQAARISAIRAKRDHPGLAPQHLAAVKAVAALCGAQTEGLALRSQEITFAPHTVRGGQFAFDVGTAGSITLVLQALLPVMLSARQTSTVTVSGGTDVRMAPPLDYFREVLLRLLARMGARVRLEVLCRGYYPRGGGCIKLEVAPSELRPLVALRSSELRDFYGRAHVANLPVHIAERMRASAMAQFVGSPWPQPRIETQALTGADAIGRGGAIVLCAQTDSGVLGAGRVAELGVRAETLGETVGRDLREDLLAGAALDQHATDQVLVYAALAGGESAFTTRFLSTHARTAMWLIKRFLTAEFASEPAGACVRVRVRGRAAP
jgi:RNA 3'-phosphate cyclase